MSSGQGDNCLHRLRAHYADLDAGIAATADVKLLLLGNGGAGKTQLGRWLSEKPFQSEWNSTHGIQIDTTDLGGEPPVRLHIWDFGGQDLYHGVHALFLGSPALLTIVWATDTEERKQHESHGQWFRDYPLAYWLDVAHYQGHRHSPVLIVQTKCDEWGQERAIPPISADRLDRPERQPKVLQVSAWRNRGRAALLESLRDAVAWLRAPQRLGTIQVGIGRQRVREQLEEWYREDRDRPIAERRHRLLSRPAFDALCAEVGGVSDPGALLTWLDAEGTVIYRPGFFDGQIVLDQAWALDAIYAPFDRAQAVTPIRQRDGRFTGDDLGRWVWQNHSEDEQRLFLSMMRSCGICFRHRGFDSRNTLVHEYIAPDLLPAREVVAPRLQALWDDDRPGEQATFRYDLLHGGLIRTILSDLGSMAGPDALYWQGGMCGFEVETGSRLLIEQVMTGTPPEDWTGEIRISTQKGDAGELLRRVIEIVEEAQQRIGLKPSAVYRPGPPDRPTLEHASTDQRLLNFAPEPNRTKIIPKKVNMDTSDNRPLIKLFVSYAHADRKLKDTLISLLETRLKLSSKFRFELWQDGEILLGEDWDREIKRAMAECQFGLLLVSPNFLVSNYIRNIELKQYVAESIDDPGNDKRALPVALEPIIFDGTMNLHGLGPRQIFRDSEGKAFSVRVGEKRKAFADALFAQIVKAVERSIDRRPQP